MPDPGSAAAANLATTGSVTRPPEPDSMMVDAGAASVAVAARKPVPAIAAAAGRSATAVAAKAPVPTNVAAFRPNPCAVVMIAPVPARGADACAVSAAAVMRLPAPASNAIPLTCIVRLAGVRLPAPTNVAEVVLVTVEARSACPIPASVTNPEARRIRLTPPAPEAKSFEKSIENGPAFPEPPMNAVPMNDAEARC